MEHKSVGAAVKFWMIRPFVVWFTFALRFPKLRDLTAEKLAEKNGRGEREHLKEAFEQLERSTFARAMAPDLMAFTERLLAAYDASIRWEDKVAKGFKALEAIVNRSGSKLPGSAKD